MLFGRPFVLLRFHAPEYETEGDRGTVTWRIEKGLLVAPRAAARATCASRCDRRARRRGAPDDRSPATVSSEVANFYPLIAGWGWFSRIGRALYRDHPAARSTSS